MNTHTIIVDIHQNMLKPHADTSGQIRAVSSTRILRITQRKLTTSQIQNRSVASTTGGGGGSGVLHSHLAHPESPHLHHREPTLDAAS